MKPVNDYSFFNPVLIIFLVIFGLLFGAIAYSGHLPYYKLKKEGVSGAGIISSVKVSGSGKNRRTRVYVTYTDNNNNTRTFRSGYTSSSMRRGQAVKIVYDPSNPANVAIDAKGQTVMFVIFELVSVCSVAGAIIGWKRRKRRKEEYKRLQLMGAGEDVPVLEVADGNIRINKSPTYRIVLNKAFLDKGYYQSQLLTFNPAPYVEGKRLRLVTDPANPEKYFIDISAVEQEHRNFGGKLGFKSLFSRK